MALRSALVLTCFVVAAGRRYADTAGLLIPEVEEVEEKTAEAIDSITPDGGDEHLIPLSSSFQFASTMGAMPVKTKVTFSLSHDATSGAEPLSIVCQLTAKSEAAATDFAKSLSDYWNSKELFLGAPPPVNVSFSAPGRQVIIKVGIPEASSQHIVASLQKFAHSIGYVDVSAEMPIDMQEILTHLSNDTVLYEAVYKGFKYSVDATLSKALEELLVSRIPDSAPPGAPLTARVAAKEMVSKLFKLFTGASADFKVAFDESVRQELLRSIPLVNITYGQAVSMYQPIIGMYPPMLRGTDIALKTAQLVSGLETIETLDTVDIRGVPGLKLMMTGNTTSGAFEFMGKFLKDVGVMEILHNTSTNFGLSWSSMGLPL